MPIAYQKSKVWKYSSIIFNLLWSISYFKQLIFPDDEKYIYILSRILFLPFIYVIAFVFILLMPSKLGFKKQYFILLIPLLFIISIVKFMFISHAFNYLIIFLFVLIEPIKNRFINNGSNTYLALKYLILGIITFLLIFVGEALPKLNAPINASAMWMGGIYFIILIIIDYKLPMLTRKIKEII